MDWKEDLQQELASLKAAAQLRALRPLTSAQGAEVVLEGRRVIHFSSNNYLGLADSPALRAGIEAGTSRWGVGAGGSRLIVGTPEPHQALERSLAQWKGTEAALVFPSGYQANVGIISCLCGPEDLILSDALNHASIIDGSRLSRARVMVYRHLDLNHLEQLLGSEAHRHRRVLLVSETLFSMDADQLDVPAWMQIATRFGAMTFLDEAHAVGVLGPNGTGTTSGTTADLLIGTFGKAFGSAGAYVCTSQLLSEWIINRCRAFIFSTAVDVPTCLAAATALHIITSSAGDELRRRLQENVDYFVSRLYALGVSTRRSHILPLRLRGGDNQAALDVSRRLLDAGLYVQAIRPPTVPPGSARLRWTLMATHTREHLDRALEVLEAERSHFQ